MVLKGRAGQCCILLHAPRASAAQRHTGHSMLGFAAMARVPKILLLLVLPVALGAPVQAQTVLRISTPAVPDDWHVKML